MKTTTRFRQWVILILSILIGCAQDREGKNATIYTASFSDAVGGDNVIIRDTEATFRLEYYQPDKETDFAEVSFLRSAPDANRKEEGDQCPEDDVECDIVAWYNFGGFIPIAIHDGTMEFDAEVKNFVTEGSFKAGVNDIGYIATFSEDLTQVEVQTWLGINGDDLITVTVDHSGGELPIFDSSQAPE